jgi:hypothetical protein
MGFPGVSMDSQTHGKITGTTLLQIQSLEEVALCQILRSFSCLAYESGTWLISLTLMHQILKLKQGECQCCHDILAPKCEWEHFFWWFKSDVFRTSFHCSFFLRIYHLKYHRFHVIQQAYSGVKPSWAFLCTWHHCMYWTVVPTYAINSIHCQLSWNRFVSTVVKSADVLSHKFDGTGIPVTIWLWGLMPLAMLKSFLWWFFK